ncbi:BCCT family transporter [Paracoccus sp. 1_MG-2023]|uniref:BCCT family transporter n=1 Tax=unclassified Paracoccus (in: a-proteobacteria) TaxID=2688777 RepID=UPI001C093E5E|nr:MULTISPECIES: BCCT family transporter [unclassified Paracoccus (in: a-proteobacteria)]MBU2958669.1 BCCT family transporter [Paracoccus sp. C2R09]MDO6667662.1 BCCT family transporter [Paracoccus sp. 1_MG-2023]
MSDNSSPDGPSGRSKGLDLPLVILTSGFILAFCALALVDLDRLSGWVDAGFAVSARWFGFYWQVLLLATFLIGLAICLLPGARTRMGGLARAEFSTLQWASMIMCTLLAGGGVFWAAGEPIAHYLSTPPIFGDLSGDPRARAHAALAQSFLHWGFLAWAILGALGTIMLMHYHHDRGLPLAPRTLLYPVFGDRVLTGPLGLIVDACCVISVVAGTVGPIGFLGLQMSYGLQALFGIPDDFGTQAAVILALVGIYSVSAVTGLSKGIRILSQFNVLLVFALLVFMLLAGPTGAIFGNFAGGFVTYVQNFFGLALYRGDAGIIGDSEWLGWWTVFFWGWFIGYGPLMAIFIARISRGRSIRSIIVMLAVIAPIVTNFWFTIIGGSGITFEQLDPGTVSVPFEGLDLPAGLLAITQAFPLGFLLSVAFLVLTMAFVATTSDSMSFVIAQSMSEGEPSTWLRAFWGVAMGVMALILISSGSGGIGKLQSFIVVTAAPVSLVLLPTLWDAPRIVWRLGRPG